MPQYVYGDANGHRKELEMTFADADKAIVFCDLCDLVMHRIPQSVRVNWGGLPPHAESARPPEIQKYVKESKERIARWRGEAKHKDN